MTQFTTFLVLILGYLQEITIPAPTQLSSETCVYCEMAVRVVEMLLQINKTEVQMECCILLNLFY